MNGLWPLTGLVAAGLLAALIAYEAIREALRLTLKAVRRPPQASTPTAGPDPAPGSRIPPGGTSAEPPLRSPAPDTHYRAPPRERLGTCTMTVNFYDTGATVTYNHVKRTREVDWPTIEDDALEAFLRGHGQP